MNCVGVVPELGAHAHWSCDKLRAGALMSHGGPLRALVKKKKHNEKAPISITLGVGVSPAKNSGAVTRISED